MNYILKHYKSYINTLILHYPIKYSNAFILKHVQTFNHLKDFLSIKYVSDIDLSDVNNEFITGFESYLHQFNRPSDTITVLKCVKSVCFIQMHSSIAYITHPMINRFGNDIRLNMYISSKSLKVVEPQLTLF